MSCINISDSNKSRITIRVIELKYYIELSAQSVISFDRKRRPVISRYRWNEFVENPE